MRRGVTRIQRLGLSCGAALVASIAFPGLLPTSQASPRRPDVVLVTVDTLRADSLGCYGHPAAGTPNFDRVAREGVLFENAVAAMPLTRPSHFSIMTAQSPRQLGVLNNSTPLPDDAVTIAEVFRAAGYRTIGAVSVALLAPGSGAEQGFEFFDAPTKPSRWPGSETLDRAAAHLRRASGEAPVFVWIHLFEPHIPYVAHEQPAAEPAEISWTYLKDVASRNQGAIPGAVLERARELYGQEVREADRLLGALLEIVDRRGAPTILAVAADHGECFENGVFFEHADCLYQGAIRVPLLVRFPGTLAPGRRTGLVELRRLGATLLSLASVEIPAGFDRTSLLSDGAPAAFFEGPVYTAAASDTLDAFTHRYRVIRRVADQEVRPFAPLVAQVGVRWGSWKYIAGGEREELFDLDRDPGETTNVAASRREVVEHARRLRAAWVAENPVKLPDSRLVDPELQKTLRSLGYLQ